MDEIILGHQSKPSSGLPKFQQTGLLGTSPLTPTMMKTDQSEVWKNTDTHNESCNGASECGQTEWSCCRVTMEMSAHPSHKKRGRKGPKTIRYHRVDLGDDDFLEEDEESRLDRELGKSSHSRKGCKAGLFLCTSETTYYYISYAQITFRQFNGWQFTFSTNSYTVFTKLLDLSYRMGGEYIRWAGWAEPKNKLRRGGFL